MDSRVFPQGRSSFHADWHSSDDACWSVRRCAATAGQADRDLNKASCPSPETAMQTGRIQQLNSDKGFGFIRPDANAPDVFFHRSVVQGPTFASLKIGQSVGYVLDASAERPRASSVELTSDADRQRPPVAECLRGFVTKLHREPAHGFISADS